MRETWYVLEDGSVADPREVSADEKGVLRNKNGVAVAMRGGAHSSRGVDPDEERAKVRPDAKANPKSKAMKADEVKPGYSTRETKAE